MRWADRLGTQSAHSIAVKYATCLLQITGRQTTYDLLVRPTVTGDKWWWWWWWTVEGESHTVHTHSWSKHARPNRRRTIVVFIVLRWTIGLQCKCKMVLPTISSKQTVTKINIKDCETDLCEKRAVFLPGWLEMLDVKMTDQCAGDEIAR